MKSSNLPCQKDSQVLKPGPSQDVAHPKENVPTTPQPKATTSNWLSRKTPDSKLPTNTPTPIDKPKILEPKVASKAPELKGASNIPELKSATKIQEPKGAANIPEPKGTSNIPEPKGIPTTRSQTPIHPQKSPYQSALPRYQKTANLTPKRLLEDPWLKFRLLMWKNFLQQWRRPLQTFAEIMLPILTMIVVLIIRSAITSAYRGQTSYPALNAYALDYSMPILNGMEDRSFSIAYSPKNPILEDVLVTALGTMLSENKQIIQKFLGMFHRKQFDISQFIPPTIIEAHLVNNAQVRAYSSSSELKGIYASENMTRIILAAVEFEDRLHSATELNEKSLSYSLRFPERPRFNSFYQMGSRDWKTDKLFPGYEVPGPRFPHSYEGGNSPGYVNEMFIALQHAISMELITRMTGQKMNELHRVMIQRFPHPPYWRDDSIMAMKLLLPLFIMISATYSAVNIVRAIVVEKELQLKETMKIMGLSTWLHWTAWFWKQFIFQIIIAVIMTILLKIHWFHDKENIGTYAVFTNTPWTVLLFFLLLYLCCMIFFCFMISTLFSKASIAALGTGMIWFLTFMPTFLLTTDADVSIMGQIISCIFINTAMAFGIQMLLGQEGSGGLQWGRIMSSPDTERSRFTFLHVLMMLIFNCVLYMLITLYLEQVIPGQFGASRPWYFPFQSDFWCPGRKSSPKRKVGDVSAAPSSKQVKTPPRQNVFIAVVKVYQAAVAALKGKPEEGDKQEYHIVQEKDPENHTIGVEIQDLTKVYDIHTVVDHLNLNIYNDQITVLLGHNGAGKTTTISMLTGNLEPTSGKVTVVGYDMSTQAPIARSHIGLCPQHNVLFDELTVQEHLKFFSRLKGLSGVELKNDIDTLIKKLELQSKRNFPSRGLSGGQKRRLCVGIALSGKAKVVLLDEPTSGMDPSSRRSLWELLQKEKRDRSMILTTHFMDEADILGDRVAIMANGRLQCVGSPYFLKHHYGLGYKLVIAKDNNFDIKRCTALINNYIPGTVVKEDRGSEVTYSLPNEYSSKFEDMFNNLEAKAKEINFKSYGLLTTTLEDVFMSVGADSAPMKKNEKSNDIHTKNTNPEIEKETHEIDSALAPFHNPKSIQTSNALLRQRLLAMWTKLAIIWRRSWWLMLLQIVIPTLLLTVALGLLEYILSLVPTIKKRILALDSGFARTETLLALEGTEPATVLAADAYQQMFEKFKNPDMTLTPIGETPVQEYYLSRTRNPVNMGILRHQMLIGSTFSDKFVTAWFSNFGYHDVAISLAAVHSALLKTYKQDSELIVYNHPLKATYEDQSDLQTMIILISMQLSTSIGSSIAITTAVYIMFYIKERVSGAKLLQRSAGIQPIVMWGSAGLYDYLWMLIFCLPIPISCIIFQVSGLCTAIELARLWICIMLYAAAIIPLTYLLSLLIGGPALGFVYYFFFNVALGMLGAQSVETLLLTSDEETREMADNLDSVLQFHPLYCLVTSIRYLNQIGLHTQRCFQMCDLNKIIFEDFICNLEELCEVDDNCCLPDEPLRTWETPGIKRYLTVTFLTGAMFWILLMAIEYGLLKQMCTKKKRPPFIDKRTVDEDVAAEANRAHKLFASSRSKQALLAIALSKYYGKHLAVNQVTFCVDDGECFGLLGVNGAGKTTTFKMIMGDESISSGDAYVSGHSVQKNLTKANENIGYCPQFDGLFLELTGRETLRIYSLMRGLRKKYLDTTAESFARALGFRKYLDRRVYKYSGGTKRKLNTAVALLGKTRIIFVDEPTTGVDPAAKRQMWGAMRGVQRAGRGIVLTSHSMEECEALCSRLTIMVNGRFQCLGTPQHLKNKFSQGFTLTIKLKSDGYKKSSVTRVKEYINLNFKDPRIMEEYQGLLTYYLPDRTIAWSRMFGIMERAKRELDIEDYTIAQTTLEQVFLQFTKYQGQNQAVKKPK